VTDAQPDRRQPDLSQPDLSVSSHRTDVPMAALRPGQGAAALRAEVRDRLALLPPEEHVVLACSGGPDSTALALLVADARPDLALTLAYVAHGLRDAADDEQDARRVKELALRLDAAVRVLPVQPVRSGAGLEADARSARLAALAALRDELQAAAILFGHHADDQAETVVQRMVRGAGIDGLAAMAVLAGTRLRPLLRIRRDDLAALVTRAGIETSKDPMNEDPSVQRVALRRDVMPALRGIAPDPVAALTRLAGLARDDADLLDRLAQEAATSLPVLVFGPVVVAPSDGIAALPTALARRVLRDMLARVSGTRGDAEDVERWLAGGPGWRATLPGPVDAMSEHGWHVVAPVVPVATGDTDEPVRFRRDEGHRHVAPWPVLGWTLTATRPQSDGLDADRAHARSDAPLPPGLHVERLSCTVGVPSDVTLQVRARRSGDRIATAGGTRTLADVMSEAGVPRALRDLLPVVVDAERDRPLWVPGLVLDVDAAAPLGDAHPASRLSVERH
jgi:tRNA(Ile)-lysidine synthase